MPHRVALTVLLFHLLGNCPFVMSQGNSFSPQFPVWQGACSPPAEEGKTYTIQNKNWQSSYASRIVDWFITGYWQQISLVLYNGLAKKNSYPQEVEIVDPPTYMKILYVKRFYHGNVTTRLSNRGRRSTTLQTCLLNVYKKADPPTCTPAYIDKTNQLVVSCQTKKIYPKGKCRLYVDGTQEPTAQISYRHEVESGTEYTQYDSPLYFTSKCYIKFDLNSRPRFMESVKQAWVTIWPDMDQLTQTDEGVASEVVNITQDATPINMHLSELDSDLTLSGNAVGLVSDQTVYVLVLTVSRHPAYDELFANDTVVIDAKAAGGTEWTLHQRCESLANCDQSTNKMGCSCTSQNETVFTLEVRKMADRKQSEWSFRARWIPSSSSFFLPEHHVTSNAIALPVICPQAYVTYESEGKTYVPFEDDVNEVWIKESNESDDSMLTFRIQGIPLSIYNISIELDGEEIKQAQSPASNISIPISLDDVGKHFTLIFSEDKRPPGCGRTGVYPLVYRLLQEDAINEDNEDNEDNDDYYDGESDVNRGNGKRKNVAKVTSWWKWFLLFFSVGLVSGVALTCYVLILGQEILVSALRQPLPIKMFLGLVVCLFFLFPGFSSGAIFAWCLRAMCVSKTPQQEEPAPATPNKDGKDEISEGISDPTPTQDGRDEIPEGISEFTELTAASSGYASSSVDR